MEGNSRIESITEYHFKCSQDAVLSSSVLGINVNESQDCTDVHMQVYMNVSMHARALFCIDTRDMNTNTPAQLELTKVWPWGQLSTHASAVTASPALPSNHSGVPGQLATHQPGRETRLPTFCQQLLGVVEQWKEQWSHHHWQMHEWMVQPGGGGRSSLTPAMRGHSYLYTNTPSLF